MRGIILAGGSGTRLYPMTKGCTKGLLPIYDKPMIFYPLSTLLENGIKDICIILNPEDKTTIENLLGNGSRFGATITYRVQEKPRGIPDGFVLASDWIKKDNVAMILGDNLFCGSNVFKRAFNAFESGGAVFAYEVDNPSRYGVVSFKNGRPDTIEEKPEEPKSNFAIPGLYIFDSSVSKVSKSLKPSERGETEIIDVIKHYLLLQKLKVYKINRGGAWLDAGTPRSLNDASEYVKVIERRQGVKIGCPEESAVKSGLIDKKTLLKTLEKMPNCDYKNYLLKL